MNTLINAAVFVYCMVAYATWSCVYHAIDALGYVLWHTLQFTNKRWENLERFVDFYYSDDN